MPELPEVETTKTSLKPLSGQKLNAIQVFQPKLRWPMPDDLDTLVGYTLQSIERRAKYLILDFSANTERLNSAQTVSDYSLIQDTRQLLVHLGMSGSLQQYPVDTDKRKHDHLVMTFSATDGKHTQLHYHDPRRFGAVLWCADYGDKLLNHLGPEPLSHEFTAEYLYHLIQRTTDNKDSLNKKAKRRPIARPIKSVIMEQQIVVGVGNIYATESLYLAGIHPATPAHQLTHAQIVMLVDHIKTILHKAIELGGSTLRDFTVASGQTGYFQQTLNVYGRQGESCPNCDTILDNIKLNGRASVYCSSCQPVNT